MIDKERDKDWYLVSQVMPKVERLLLFGPPGTGKTYAAQKHIPNAEVVFPITLTPDTPAAELRGFYAPGVNANGQQEFVWRDGIGIMAWRKSHEVPTRLVLNEISHAGPDCISMLYVLTDDIVTASITLPTGEVVTPGPYLQIVATMNDNPAELLDGLQDRFPVQINIRSPHPDAIDKLPEHMREMVRKNTVIDNPARAISLRIWNEFLRLSERLGGTEESELLAASAVAGDRAMEIVNSVRLARTK